MSKLMPKVHIIHSSAAYVSLFANAGWMVTSNHEDADLFCFTGGEDVSPHLYGEKQHPWTQTSAVRDAVEQKMFNHAVDNGIPMVGICRGGQFLNVMSGGKMYQHVSNHALAHGHVIEDLETGLVVFASSTHHQMMRPSSEAVVVATINLGGTKEHCADLGTEGKAIIHGPLDEDDIEVVWYPTTDCLCFQPHPEFGGADYSELKEYFFSLIHKFFSLKG